MPLGILEKSKAKGLAFFLSFWPKQTIPTLFCNYCMLFLVRLVFARKQTSWVLFSL